MQQNHSDVSVELFSQWQYMARGVLRLVQSRSSREVTRYCLQFLDGEFPHRVRYTASYSCDNSGAMQTLAQHDSLETLSQTIKLCLEPVSPT